jgi:hypothetical protein
MNKEMPVNINLVQKQELLKRQEGVILPQIIQKAKPPQGPSLYNFYQKIIDRTSNPNQEQQSSPQ